MNLPRYLATFFLFAQVAIAFGGTPVATHSRLVVELVAREPEILTPTGIAVDEGGRIWVIENNTHERPAAYHGYPSDRVRIFSPCDAQGRSHPIGTFADGFRNTMGLALGKHGVVYVATRSDIYLLRDTHGTGVADERRVVVRLDTTASYPHNGLSGFAFDALGNLYFGLGENLGAKYKLIGSDGTILSGGGEGGSIYRCRPDGTGLVRIATGFWNPFHLAFDAFGRLFAVDNDPDSRGPCRLLHIVPGGDYGYRYRNGRKGLHPFTAWNGELPGTLPMVAGTAEAPCGVLAYEATGLPPEYQGNLLVTSWGDHIVERFVLAPRGASFTSQSQTLVKGDEDFRPVGITTGPDGSLYLTDWVDKSYPVHGKGRIWRIRWKSAPADDGLRPLKVEGQDSRQLRALLADPRRPIRDAAGEALAQKVPEGRGILARALADRKDTRLRMQALWAAANLGRKKDAMGLLSQALSDPASEVRGEAASLFGRMLSPKADEKDERQLLHLALEDASAFVRMQATLQLRGPDRLAAVVPRLADPDPFLAGAALEVLGKAGNAELLTAQINTPDPKQRLGIVTALRRTGDLEARRQLPRFLADPDPAVRRSAIQWVGEERLREYAPLLEAAAARVPVTRDVFEALLATKELLTHQRRAPKDERGGDEYVLKVVKDVGQPPAIRAVALRMLRPDHPGLGTTDLARFLENSDSDLRSEAVRTLALRSDEPSQAVLRRIAADAGGGHELRAEAVLGLAHSAASVATGPLLLSLLNEPAIRIDALRSLRQATARPDVAEAVLTWWAKIASTPIPAEARRELAAQVVVALRSFSKSQRLDPIRQAVGLRPRAPAEWQSALAGQGSPVAGERVFFHPDGPRCFACHRVDGRGTAIGPDLSTIGASLSREKLIESILLPSKEIAPQFVSWSIATNDGKVRTGLIVEEGPNSTVTIADSQGKLETINRITIEERHAMATSIMPDNLHELMTVGEFRDVIAFLQSRK
jgi:putative membrane-bound dehydrogenase-like protein